MCLTCGTLLEPQTAKCPSCGTVVGAQPVPKTPAPAPLHSDLEQALHRARSASQEDLPPVDAGHPVVVQAPPGPSAPAAPGHSHKQLRAVREERTILPVRINDVLSGRYRLEQKVGEGGMGAVYVAHDQELDRRVAVKLLAPNLVHDDEVVERFEREARLTAKLDHPNIVPVYDVGRHEGRPFIVMKLLQGDTLAGLLRDKGGLTADETMRLLKQVGAGLDYIHDKGFIHRDIKAGNIFVAEDGLATILDFGILRPRHATDGLTRTGMVMGTPHYMAPEQALGLKNVDHRVDLYALAVVLFECLTGTLPFEADSELRLIQMQAHSPPPEVVERAPWIPKPVAAVVRRALAKRPEDRFMRCSELVGALEAAYKESKSPGPATQLYGGPQVPPTTAPSWRAREGNVTEVDRPARGGQSGVGAASPQAGAPLATGGSGVPEAPSPASPAPSQLPPMSPALLLASLGGPTAVAEAPVPTQSRAPQVVLGVLAAAALAAGLFAWQPWAKKPVVPDGAGGGAGGGAQVVGPPVAEVDAGAEPEVDAGATQVAEVPDAGEAVAVADTPDAGDENGDADEDGGASLVKRPKKKGRLNVITTHGGEPWWASVLIDGVPKGRTPLLLDLPAGSYHMRVERAGFKSQERQIRVASGKKVVVRIALSP